MSDILLSTDDEVLRPNSASGWKKRAIPFGAAVIFLGSMAVVASTFNKGHDAVVHEHGFLRRLDPIGTEAPTYIDPVTPMPSDEASVDPITPVPSDEASVQPVTPVPSDEATVYPVTPIPSDEGTLIPVTPVPSDEGTVYPATPIPSDVGIFDDYESDFGKEFKARYGGDITPERQAMFMWGAAKFVLGGLANGALGKFGEDLTGWALGALGINYGNSDELAKIQSQLEDQAEMLSDIQNTLDAIQNQLSVMLQEILNAIEEEGDRIRFEGWVQALNTATGQINGLSESLYSLTFATPGTHNQERIVNLR